MNHRLFKRASEIKYCNDSIIVNRFLAIIGSRGDLLSITPPSIRPGATTSTDAIIGISPDVFQQIEELLRRVIEDAARQGINITPTTNLTSPYQLFTLVVAQDPRIQSDIVVPTPNAYNQERREPSLHNDSIRDHGRETCYDRGDRYDDNRRRSQSASTDEEVLSKRHREATLTQRYNIRDTQVIWRASKDPYGLIVCQKFDECGEPEGEREVLLRRIEALEWRQGHRNLLICNFGSPFTALIRQERFLEKFRRPHVEQFKANTDPQEHVRRSGSRWFGGLASGSIRNFVELIQEFTRQFIGNIQRRKSISVLSTLRQRKDETLKDYLTRFSQEVSEVQDPNDDTVVAVFVNSLQHSQLSLNSQQKELTTYASLVDAVGGYAMVEEEQIAHGGELIHGGRLGEGQKSKDSFSKGYTEGDQKKYPRKGSSNDEDQKGNKTFKRQYTNYTTLA
ncbi:hypothetical protein Dsin_017217 [Dipteronia sinensis]|uniref:Retrotransposon gag domain-containing protein n=1 Tax=Dipteronia sinensis TaxID=43782 RepID=A0AAE0E678_9ROSI|nr:hypothetical protein Dsin_017217 [Dipteronia sinensis]